MYTIIGNGRLARHLVFYFSELALPYQQWYRQLETPLSAALEKASHVFILINDDAIETFIQTHYAQLQNRQLIHCSGAHLSEWAHTAHIPMSFGHTLYSVEEYKTFPFILEKEGPSFAELLPGLPNPHFTIPRKEKAYYHALCVMANNFTTLLWQKTFSEFENRFDIPSAALMPYLKKTCSNLQENYKQALTGPLSRGDEKTLQKNLESLKEDAFFEVYQSFVNSYKRNRIYENS